MPTWVPPYKIRRSTRILSYAINQLESALNLMGEPVYLLKRMARANAPTVQKENRRVSTITQTASAYSTDPDTGNLRALLWSAATDLPTTYPDRGVFTATVSASASTDVWDVSVDKYSFIGGDRQEYAFDEYRNELNPDGSDRTHEVYIIFAPAMHVTNSCIMTYGIANPQTKFESMQLLRDNELPDFGRSLFGYQQNKDPTARIRGSIQPHCFKLCFPSLETDFVINSDGLLQNSAVRHWTGPPPLSPALSEFDVIVRKVNGVRYQIIDFTRIYLESILCQQQFSAVELDPRSAIYSIPVETT